MGKKKRAKHRSRLRKGQPFVTSSEPQLAIGPDPALASQSASDAEPIATFNPTPLERKAERDQERRAWGQVDKAP